MPSHVIDHIAAGEVVERPASVAKELVENALDAGATHVTVVLQGGGLEHLAITDNGCGMSPAQARLCLTRHATSKLTCTEDLSHIATLGFRGEALSSIASVSRLRLVTRPAGAVMGYEIRVEGGTVVYEGAVGSPYGTHMVVDDLFFNTPARRKFMRAPATEQTHVVEAIKRVLLGARKGGVSVTHAQRRLLDIPEDAASHQRVRGALGRNVGALAPFEAAAGEVRATGFVGVGQGERHEARNLWLFVNGRFVRDRHLSRAVIEAMGHRTWDKPAIVVAYLEVPPARVDVNVHPQKLEVRFADGRDAFSALGAGVLQGVQALGAESDATSYSKQHAGAAPPDRGGHSPYGTIRTGAARRPAPASHALAQSFSTQGATQTPSACADSASPRPLGSGYFMCQAQNETFIVHWPTLARRQALCQWQQEACAGAPRLHTLLLPEPMEGRAPWQNWLAEAHTGLQAYGFDITPVGPGHFLVRAVPEALACGRAHATALRFVETAYARREQLADRQPEAMQAVIAPCVAALEVGEAADTVATYLADADWTHLCRESGVVRVTAPMLRTLFTAR